MSKNGTNVPITQLTGLRINYEGKNSTFSVPEMTIAQQRVLVNNDVIGQPIVNGTIVYITDTSNFQVFQNGSWRILQVGAANDAVTTAIDASVNGGVTLWSGVSGTSIAQMNSGGNVTLSSNLLVNNTGGAGVPLASTVGQLMSFSGNDGSVIVPATNAGGGALLAGKVKVEAFALTHQRTAGGKVNELPNDLAGFSGLDIIDYLDYGLITVNEAQFITLQFDTTTVSPTFGNQNILMTDDQNSTDPTTYSAIVEMRSSKGGFLPPRMTTTQISALENVKGLMVYDLTQNSLVINNGTGFAPSVGGVTKIIAGTNNVTLSPTSGVGDVTISVSGGSGGGNVTGPVSSVNNTVALFNGTTGQLLVDSTLTYSSGVLGGLNSISLGVGSAVQGFAANSTGTAPVTWTLPATDGSSGQVLSTNGVGLLSWATDGGGGGGNVTGPTTTVANTVAMWNNTSGTLLSDATNLTLAPYGVGGHAFGLDSLAYLVTGPNAGGIALKNKTNTATTVGIVSSAVMAADYTITLPANAGNPDQVLSTDGDGNTSWVTNAGGGGVVGPASTVIGEVPLWSVTDGSTLSASSYLSGTVNSGVANTFTVGQSIHTVVGLTNPFTGVNIIAPFNISVQLSSCSVATTITLNAVYNNNTFTLTNNGAKTVIVIDGTTLTLGTRVLVKNGVSGGPGNKANGIYVVTVVGSPTVFWQLTRSSDYDTSAQTIQGSGVQVIGGSTFAGTTWVQTQENVVLDFNNIIFEQITDVVGSLEFGINNNTEAYVCKFGPSVNQATNFGFTLPAALPSAGLSPILTNSNGVMSFDNGVQVTDGGLILAGTIVTNGNDDFDINGNSNLNINGTGNVVISGGGHLTSGGSVLGADLNLIGNLIVSTGIVSIGTGAETNGGYVTINGFLNKNYAAVQHAYVTPNNMNNDNTSFSGSFSILCPNGGINATQFNAVSSIGVKKVIARDVITEATELLKQISVVKYNYKDQLKNGNGAYYGVIAEELREVMPELVHDSNNYIPNIMKKAMVNGYTPTIRDTARDMVVTFDEPIADLGILIEKKIELYSIKGIITGSVLSNNDQNINIRLDKEIKIAELPKEIFVYGTEENCPSVGKDRLSELNLAVTQGLLKRIEILEQKLGA